MLDINDANTRSVIISDRALNLLGDYLSRTGVCTGKDLQQARDMLQQAGLPIFSVWLLLAYEYVTHLAAVVIEECDSFQTSEAYPAYRREQIAQHQDALARHYIASREAMKSDCLQAEDKLKATGMEYYQDWLSLGGCLVTHVVLQLLAESPAAMPVAEVAQGKAMFQDEHRVIMQRMLNTDVALREDELKDAEAAPA